MFTDSEQNDIILFMTQHATLHAKIEYVIQSLKYQPCQEVVPTPEVLTTTATSTQISTVGASKTPTAVAVASETQITTVASGSQSPIVAESQTNSSDSAFSDNDEDNNEDSDDDELELANLVIEEEACNSQATYLASSSSSSQFNTRTSVVEESEWAKDIFVKHQPILKPTYFYLVIYSVHNTSVQDWLVKIGITSASDKKFKERYSIYYRNYFYFTVPIANCRDASSFAYYDAQQKTKINENMGIKKYNTSLQEMTSLQQDNNMLREFNIHVAESSGEVYYLGGPTTLAFMMETLTAVAELPYAARAAIALPYISTSRIQKLEDQMFNTTDLDYTCLATKLYQDGHFSMRRQGNATFDFPLSIKSVKNICHKLYDKMKSNLISPSWRSGRWEIRILWVGIGLAEESILIVLYFRQLGVFIKVFGLELDADVVQQALQTVQRYSLDMHFNIKKQDVLEYNINTARNDKIDVIYTTAVVDYLFMWKLHQIGIAAARVQVLLAPQGGMSNLHHIQDGEGTFTGPSLGFYPQRRSPKVIVQFCNDSEVATSSRDEYQCELQFRPMKAMSYTDDMHNTTYLDVVCESGRTYQMESILKQFTPGSGQHLKDRLIRSFETDRQGSLKSINVDQPQLHLDITTEEWKRWKKKYDIDKTCSYAFSNIRKKLKAIMVNSNMFCDTFPSNLTVSSDPVEDTQTNTYRQSDIEYINDAFSEYDHPHTRPITYTAQPQGVAVCDEQPVVEAASTVVTVYDDHPQQGIVGEVVVAGCDERQQQVVVEGVVVEEVVTDECDEQQQVVVVEEVVTECDEQQQVVVVEEVVTECDEQQQEFDGGVAGDEPSRKRMKL
jgi:hypothetical protein